MAKLDFDALNAMQRYLQFAVFRAIPGALGSEREELTKEAQQFFADLEAEGKVVVRGIYDNTGIRADADFMIWWHAEHFEELQKALADFRRTTTLGQLLEVAWLGPAHDCSFSRLLWPSTCSHRPSAASRREGKMSPISPWAVV